MGVQNGAAHTSLGAHVDALDGQAFDRLMLDFNDSSYEQTSVLTDDLWGAANTSHLVVRSHARAIGGARVVVLAPPLLRRGLAYVKFGPFWRRRDDEQTTDLAGYRHVVAALVEEYAHRRGHCVTVSVRPSRDFMAAESAVLADLGFVQRRAFWEPERYLVRIMASPEAQMRDLDQKWRYKLRQALGASVTYDMCRDAPAVAVFQELHIEMAARKGMAPPASLDLLARMLAAMPPAMAPHVMLAMHEGRAVAGAVFGVTGDTAVYLYGAANTAGRALHAGYGLQWRIVEWLREQGVAHYDMGGTEGQQGLHQFKKGLLGRSGAIVAIPDEYDYWSDARGRLGADVIFAARALRRRLRLLRARLF